MPLRRGRGFKHGEGGRSVRVDHGVHASSPMDYSSVMAAAPDFDVASAHRYFSAFCFNSAWDLMDKSARTAQEDEQMLLRAWASLYHWMMRPDCAAQNRSVSLWQISRVYSLLGDARNSLTYAESRTLLLVDLDTLSDGAPS